MIKSTSIKRAFIKKIINDTNQVSKGNQQGTDMNIKLFKMDFFLGNEYSHNRSKSNYFGKTEENNLTSFEAQSNAFKKRFHKKSDSLSNSRVITQENKSTFQMKKKELVKMLNNGNEKESFFSKNRIDIVKEDNSKYNTFNKDNKIILQSLEVMKNKLNKNNNELYTGNYSNNGYSYLSSSNKPSGMKTNYFCNSKSKLFI